MTRQIHCKTFLMIATLAILSTAWPVAARAPPEGAKPKPEKELSDAEKETRRASEEFVSGIDLEIFSDDKWTKVKRIEKPLLLFGDATRGYDQGSFWAWGDKGRPVTTLELFYQKIGNAGGWQFCITNMSGGKVRASRGGELWWRENESDVVLKDIPQAPAPPVDASQRQRQLKLLSQKFTGHEIWNPNNSRYELRRIERPVHTYRDEDHGLLEGGLFILANGTNPEILLFLEARADPKEKSKAVWQFMLARSANAELHLQFDGNEVFDLPRGRPGSGADKPYFNGGIRIQSDADPKK
jgi:hypothetical protein